MTDTTTINSRANHWAHPKLAAFNPGHPRQPIAGGVSFLTRFWCVRGVDARGHIYLGPST